MSGYLQQAVHCEVAGMKNPDLIYCAQFSHHVQTSDSFCLLSPTVCTVLSGNEISSKELKTGTIFNHSNF